MEKQTSDAMTVATIPGDVLLLQTLPPSPKLGLFPPRFGWERGPVTVMDLIRGDIEDLSGFRNTGWSGGQGQGYEGTSRDTSVPL
jgi:hypothetical protein